MLNLSRFGGRLDMLGALWSMRPGGVDPSPASGRNRSRAHPAIFIHVRPTAIERRCSPGADHDWTDRMPPIAEALEPMITGPQITGGPHPAWSTPDLGRRTCSPGAPKASWVTARSTNGKC